jgi:hypothetical protein
MRPEDETYQRKEPWTVRCLECGCRHFRMRANFERIFVICLDCGEVYRGPTGIRPGEVSAGVHEEVPPA